MRRLLTVVALISTILYGDGRIENYSIKTDRGEINIDIPSNISGGDRVKIVGIMTNLGGDAEMGGLTLSFPQLKDIRGGVERNRFDKITKYSPPDRIYNRRVKRKIESKYLMIEGWNGRWRSRDSREFSIEIDVPTELDYLIINVRGVLRYRGGEMAYIPKKSEVEDQQDFDVYQIKVPIGGNGGYDIIGTGFFVNQFSVVTNQHVVDGCREIYLSRDGFNSRAKLLSVDGDIDLATLSSEKGSSIYLKFRDDKRVRIGEDIITMGYPLNDILGRGIKLTRGNVSGTTGPHDDSSYFQFTAPVQSGSSGGPILDIYGNIIGVVHSGLKNEIAQNVNFAIKSSILKKFLYRNGIRYDIGKSGKKLEVVDIADDAKDAIVEVICR